MNKMGIKVDSLGGLIGLVLLIPVWYWVIPFMYHGLPQDSRADTLRYVLLLIAAALSWCLLDRLERKFPRKLWPKSWNQRASGFMALKEKWIKPAVFLLVFSFIALTAWFFSPRPGEWSGAMHRAQENANFSDRFGVCLCWLPTGYTMTDFDNGARWQKKWNFLVIGRRDFGIWIQWEQGTE